MKGGGYSGMLDIGWEDGWPDNLSEVVKELKRILRMEKVMKVVVEEEMCYKKYMKVMKSLGDLNNKQVEIRNVVYTNMDRKTYGEQIPEGVTIINEKYLHKLYNIYIKINFIYYK